MNGFPVREGDYTFEEFLECVSDGEKADLLDGAIYLASPDNTEAAELLTWLTVILGGFVAARDLGKIYTSRVAYRINQKRGPEPDIGFVPKEHMHSRKRGFIDGPPMLAIEIVSPDSVARDYIQKRAIYEQAGVREYWILDPDEHRATFLALCEGRYEEIMPSDNLFKSEVLPGLVLDVRWLADQPRPEPYHILRDLLHDER
ncbi:MAG TPA: Uma2 family endonuclease [Gemmataceae bacterium]|nr:Uma2 family endonuclease [Gemmataceae bacterium]